MDSPYVVPIIPYNLRKNETVIQVAEALNHLTNVTESVFNRISKRVDSNNEKLNEISARIDKVNNKIVKLTGAKKATQVFSSCKYPATEVNRQYISLFADAEPVKLIRNKVKHTNFVSNDEPLEKLQLYHVKVKSNDEKTNLVGLGEIPENVNYVNDVLLYNTGKNLYKNFVMSDALDFTQQVRKQESIETSTIEAAPYSITERANQARSTVQPYLYSPNLGEVPSLDVPLDLPDLPGIADDLRYEKDEGPGIAPSVAATPLYLDLPSIEPPAKVKVQQIQEEHLPLPPPPAVTIIKEKEEPKPVPVTVRESPEKQLLSGEIVMDVQDNVTLPPTSDQPASNVLSVQQPDLHTGAPPTVDVHTSLMEAIRKAGGAKNAKLKSVDKEKQETKKTSVTGDLMADLHAKLSMRRKGISGSKKQESALDGSSVMEKVSAMIPPPVPKSETTDSTNTEDEEWDE